ncbi:MAG: 4-hydroxy-tetrahydrodipicolinate reductase [Flavobacteriaceae bacterium]|nr:4-hydroxy-tetrahydrodipicolinate reductase [Flavobacteriaceae bacterium]
MKIALLGYGRMGKMIEQIALKRGHQIAAKIDDSNKEIDFTNIDAAIDFSIPDAAFNNITNCFKNGIPVVSGTTGWLHQYEEAIDICQAHQGAFIYASNFSLGVNLFFELNNYLAKLMKNQDNYQVEIEEIHHTKKLDAPSGTAISLAEGILEHHANKNWKLGEGDEQNIPIHAVREGDVPGTHTISYDSEVDHIHIQHKANNREGFALGAVIAAEWLFGKTGVFSMRDVLNIS